MVFSNKQNTSKPPCTKYYEVPIIRRNISCQQVFTYSAHSSVFTKTTSLTQRKNRRSEVEKRNTHSYILVLVENRSNRAISQSALDAQHLPHLSFHFAPRNKPLARDSDPPWCVYRPQQLNPATRLGTSGDHSLTAPTASTLKKYCIFLGKIHKKENTPRQ